MQLSIRVPADLARELDAVMELRSKQAGGIPVRKTDLVVHALREWIASVRPKPTKK